jgi:hypothetical protein
VDAGLRARPIMVVDSSRSRGEMEKRIPGRDGADHDAACLRTVRRTKYMHAVPGFDAGLVLLQAE